MWGVKKKRRKGFGDGDEHKGDSSWVRGMRRRQHIGGGVIAMQRKGEEIGTQKNKKTQEETRYEAAWPPPIC